MTHDYLPIALTEHATCLSVKPPARSRHNRALRVAITSIGFIGGGAIIKDGASVRGTATAASILNAGVIGASVALGRYDIGLVIDLLNLITLRGLKPLKERLDRDAGH